ncbi:hypothetical protein QYE76_053029 [Lolium multiflorum]|uniref:AP2/ERF domain-containing protein n=1 Tax=Lolium multiflorum TaxID=4521 RepID=A0AAD8WM49_LOLMU|nr:hypothetical protein QYE76_053029 [Lolium multiflorum]
MPPRRRGSSGFRGVRVRPRGRFYAEIRAGGFRLTLGTYNTPELAARAYDAAAWRFRRPRRDMNFPDVESLEEAEFLAPAPSSSMTRTVAGTARYVEHQDHGGDDMPWSREGEEQLIEKMYTELDPKSPQECKEETKGGRSRIRSDRPPDRTIRPRIRPTGRPATRSTRATNRCHPDAIPGLRTSPVLPVPGRSPTGSRSQVRPTFSFVPFRPVSPCTAI